MVDYLLLQVILNDCKLQSKSYSLVKKNIKAQILIKVTVK